MSFADHAKKILDNTNESIMGYELDLRFDIANFINDQLAIKRITKKELASRLGMKPSQLSRVLCAESNITLKTVARIFKAFKLKARIVENTFLMPTTVSLEGSLIIKKTSINIEDNISFYKVAPVVPRVEPEWIHT